MTTTRAPDAPAAAPPASTPHGERIVSWRTRLAALRNIGPLVRMAWTASPSQMCISLGLRLIGAFVPIATLWISKLIVDRVVSIATHGGTDWSDVWWLLLGELLLVAGGEVMTRLTELSDGLLAARFTHTVNIRLIEHTSSVDLATLEDPVFLDKLERARTHATARLDLLMGVGRIGQNLVTLGSYAAGVLWFSPLLFALLLGSVVPAFIGETHFAAISFMLAVGQTPYRRELEYLRFLGASRESAKEIKMFGLGAFLTERYAALSERFYQEQRALGVRRAMAGSALALVGALGYYAAYAVVLHRTLSGALTIGAMTFLAGTFLRSRTSLQVIFSGLSGVADQAMFLTSLFDFLAVPPGIATRAGARRAPRPIRRGLEFRHVSFRYHGSDRLVLRDVNFALAPGERLALVGENGAGKTTVVKLMTRLYDPTDGVVLLDGVDLREYDLDDLRREVGVIFQDFVRFEMRVRENIGLGSVEHLADAARVQRAAEKSRAADVVSRLPLAYEQMLGRVFSGGVELSGGEWQKIALSRAYMRDPQVLILDEPTAALDARAEYEVFRSFADIARDRMAVLISHRFSTVRMADRILVLEQGEVREQGTHHELLGRAGRYAELFRIQANGYQM